LFDDEYVQNRRTTRVHDPFAVSTPLEVIRQRSERFRTRIYARRC